MVVIRPVSAGRERYWIAGGEPGQWRGGAAALLGLAGEVAAGDLRRLLSGDPLPRVRPSRRGGFDVVMAAPKSVSLVAAMTGASERGIVIAAHDAAVVDTLGYLERHAARTRVATGAAGLPARITPVEGLVGAAFRHPENRRGDPHLHTHVVVANLCRAGGEQWRCLDSRALYAHARSATAIYQASLRHALAARGLALAWRLHPEGWADIADVPRGAIDACSPGKRKVGRATKPRALEGADSPPATWLERTAAAGFDVPDAERIIASAMSRSPLGAGPDITDDELRSRVERAGSTFGFADAVIAAATVPAGGRAPDIEGRAARLLQQAVSVPSQGRFPRWSTAHQLSLEQRLVDRAVVAADRPPAGAVALQVAETALALRPELATTTSAAARRLLVGGEAVVVVRSASQLGMAQAVEAAHAGWAAGFHRVALAGPSREEVNRWAELTGIETHGAIPTVVVVAAAEMMPLPDLAAVLDAADRRRAKVVLVDTGRRPGNTAVGRIAEHIVPVDPGGFRAEPNPMSVRSTAVVSPSIGDAIAALARDAVASGRPAIATGIDEVRALNTAARATLARGPRGRFVEAAGIILSVGDRVLALKGARQLAIAGGDFGTVTRIEAASLLVRWDTGRETAVPMDYVDVGRLGHGYATTPAYAPEGVVPGLGTTHLVASAPTSGVRIGGESSRRFPSVGVAVDPAEAARQARTEANRSTAELAAELAAIGRQSPAADLTAACRRTAIEVAIGIRQELLGAAMAHQPTRAVVVELGPRPEMDDGLWRRAAGAIEAHRERFGLADGPLRWRQHGQEPERAAAELALAALCRDVSRERGRGLA